RNNKAGQRVIETQITNDQERRRQDYFGRKHRCRKDADEEYLEPSIRIFCQGIPGTCTRYHRQYRRSNRDDTCVDEVSSEIVILPRSFVSREVPRFRKEGKRVGEEVSCRL